MEFDKRMQNERSVGEMVRVVDEEPGMQPEVAMPSLESETFE